jgi:hypothetical protein
VPRPGGAKRYLGIFAIADVANGTVKTPPALLASTPQTIGCPASALRTL